MNRDSGSKFENMSTYKLEAILRNSLKDWNSSPEDLLLISEILEKRDAGKGIGPPNAEDAWGRFLKRQQGIFSGSPPETVPRRKSHQGRLLHRCAVLAICIFSVASIALTAQAFGYSLLGAIVHWTADTFHFETVSPGGHEGVCLEDNFFKDGELPVEFTPSWLPDGFEEFAGKHISAVGFHSVYKEYVNGENTLLFNLIQYDSLRTSDGEIFEKQSENVERYIHDEKEFTLTRNGESDYWTAAWTNGTLVFLIQGNVSKADLIKTIDF